MEQILAITGQPGVSVGVLYRGQVILNQGLGHRNVSTQAKADEHTLYCIASLTKGFVSVALNTVINGNKLSWSDKAAKFVPGLGVQEDPTLVDRLSLADLVSHRSGLNSLDQLIQDLDGRILVAKDKVVPSTTADWDTFTSDSNLAQPYTCLGINRLHPLPQPELSASTLHGCAGGIRSSVTDMLKWCQAVISATNTNSQGEETNKILSDVSPCFESAAIIDPASMAAGNYCLGWVKQTTPATLGMISPNRRFFSPMLGKESLSKLVYHHNVCDRRLDKCHGMSDCTDWIMQDLAQEMFNFQPKNDYVALAKQSAVLFANRYHGSFVVLLQVHQVKGTEQPPQKDFTGEYTRSKTNSAALNLVISEEDSRDEATKRGYFNMFESWEEYLVDFGRRSDGVVAWFVWKLGGVPEIYGPDKPMVAYCCGKSKVHRMESDTTGNAICQITGNGDIYGMGVRLGIYFQWATSIIVENVYQTEIPATRAAGNCYQIAMLAGLIRISQYPSDKALALEGYIVLLFCFVGVWASSIGLQDLLPKRSQSSDVSQQTTAQANSQVLGFGQLISVSLSTATCAYGTWFLFNGINKMARQEKNCNEVIFFFAKVKLFGWVLIIFKVFFILGLIGSACLLIYQSYDIAQNFGILLDEWTQAPADNTTDRAGSISSPVAVGAVKLMGSVLAMGVFAVSIELTLKWNHITGVYRCDNFSQVFALVVGGLYDCLVPDITKRSYINIAKAKVAYPAAMSDIHDRSPDL
ncbi:putative penicillin-binding protein [Fusarium austroafricanum]|uniref:Putative penicillin-binding protein n=1 Tax=Fusarium austroafricanum TaxID=2364996 RepID=A0A8H4JYB9_9HYPO|nr:putative penicillin-binding protein [Fusarium austroafricanum]